MTSANASLLPAGAARGPHRDPVEGAIRIGIGGRRRQWHDRPRRSERERACARCDRAFQPTLVRRLTCQSCYLANTDIDPVASRGEPTRSIGHSRTVALDG